MAVRKIIQNGKNALAICLPMKWVNEQNLQKGDYLVVEMQGDALRAKPVQPQLAKISIQAEQYKDSLFRLLSNFYRQGIDIVEITYQDRNTKYFHRNKYIPLHELIHTFNECNFAYTDFYHIPEQKKYVFNFETENIHAPPSIHGFINKNAFMLSHIAKEILDAYEQGDQTKLKQITYFDRNLNKITNYCRRTLQKDGYINPNLTIHMHTLMKQLEEMGNELKFIAATLSENPRKTDKNKQHLYDVFSLLQDLLDKIHTQDWSVFNLSKKVNLLTEKGITLIKAHDDRVLIHLNNLLKLIYSASSAIGALHTDRFDYTVPQQEIQEYLEQIKPHWTF